MTASLLAAAATTAERHAKAEGTNHTAIPELALYRSSVVSEHDAFVYESCLCLVVQGAKEVLLGKDIYRYEPGESLLVSVDLPVKGRIVQATPQQPCLAIRIALDTATVGEVLSEIKRDVITQAPSTRAIVVSPVEPSLLGAVTRLVELLDSPKDIRSIAPLILREITYRILTGPQGRQLQQIASVGAPAQRIAVAIRWLREHFADGLKVESLAKKLSMSPSAFHHHFKEVTSMSPLQYQKRLRLEEARRLMLGNGLDAAEAAFQVGYESPSQFSREYRRMFGAPPRRDVAALKV
jgi:AraC-like DNA-binding protein